MPRFLFYRKQVAISTLLIRDNYLNNPFIFEFTNKFNYL